MNLRVIFLFVVIVMFLVQPADAVVRPIIHGARQAAQAYYRRQNSWANRVRSSKTNNGGSQGRGKSLGNGKRK